MSASFLDSTFGIRIVVDNKYATKLGGRPEGLKEIPPFAKNFREVWILPPECLIEFYSENDIMKALIEKALKNKVNMYFFFGFGN